MRRFHYSLLRFVTWFDGFVREKLTGAGKLAAISAFMAAVVGLDTHQSLASQVFALLAAMLVLSACMSLLFRPQARVRRSLPRLATAGEELSYRICVSNADAKPLADTQRCRWDQRSVLLADDAVAMGEAMLGVKIRQWHLATGVVCIFLVRA